MVSLRNDLDSLQTSVDTEVSHAIARNGAGLAQLLERVNHFVRSLLKVKELPAEVNALTKKIKVLDETLLSLVVEQQSEVGVNETNNGEEETID